MIKLHSKKDLNYYYKFLFFGLIPLALYAFIKNGILLYLDYDNIFNLIKPLFFILTSLILGLGFDYYFNKKIIISKFSVIYFIYPLLIPIGTPWWLFGITLIILAICLIFLKDGFNSLALVKLLNAGVLFLLGRYNYGNLLEQSGKYVYSYFDLFFKPQVGGLGTSYLLLVLSLLIVLLFNVLYKKNISLFALGSFLITLFVLAIFGPASIYLRLAINASLIFEIIFVLSLSFWSPYTFKGQVIYGILVGLTGALLSSLLIPYEGVSIAILIFSPLKNLFDKKFA